MIDRGGAISDSDFVGRASELRIFRAAIAAVLGQEGRIILLAGEPGIGKTRAAEKFAAEARGQGARVVWGRCYEGEGAPALWPWIQILRGVIAEIPPVTLQGWLGEIDDDDPLRVLIPGWRRSAAALANVVPVESPSVRFRLFDSLTRLLANAAMQAPLVVVVDDLHCADSASLSLLQFVAREVRNLPLLIMATYRDNAEVLPSPLTAAVADLLRAPGTERVALKGLGPADVADYIERRSGRRPTPSFVAALAERTDGNALFVAEFVRLLLDEGRLGASDDGAGALVMVPDRVRTVLVRRMVSLSEGCRELLLVAATMGREFSLAVVSRVLASVERGVESAALAEAHQAGILAPVADTSTRWRFGHALMRDVVYEDAPLERRETLHRAVGLAIEELDSEGERFAELAFHFARASAGDSQARALRYAQGAAAQAAARTAYHEAIDLYQMALRLNAAGMPADESHHCELRLALGHVQLALSDRSAARATFRRATEVARGLPDTPAAAEYLARAAVGYAGGWAGVGDVGQFQADRAAVFDAEAVNLLEEARTALGDRESALRARVLSQLAVQRHFIASVAERVALSHEAVELARRVGEPATLGYVRSVEWVVGWSPDNAAERVAAADEIIACAARAGDRSLAVGGHFQRIGALLELGAAEELERESVVVTQLADSLKQPQWLWRAQAHDIMVALMEGRFDAARAGLDAARRDQSHDDSTARVFLALQLTALQRERGQGERLKAAAAFLKAVVDQYPSVPSLRTRLAYLYAESAQLNAAAEELAYVARQDFQDFPRDLTWMNALAEAAEACCAVADRPRAAVLYEQLLPYAARHVVFLGGALSWGSVARLLGMLAGLLERWDEAIAHFEMALAANRRLGARVWVAYTHFAYGRMLLHRGAPGDAPLGRYAVEQAGTIAEAVGMRALIDRVTALLSSIETSETALRPATTDRREERPAHFYREGDSWTIMYDGRLVRLRNARGLQFLDRLLRHPGREFHVLDLVLDGGGRVGAEPSQGQGTLADTGAVLDAAAKAAYRQRLDALRSELAEAESHNDLGRSERLRDEIEVIMEELRVAVGLGGRDRRTGAPAERARMSVTKRIHDVLKKLQTQHPALGNHLSVRIKTGYFCAYVPNLERPVEWQFEPE